MQHGAKILRETCDTWTGNSGGGIISLSDDFLYGIVSYGTSGVNSFYDNRDKDYMASALQFSSQVYKLKSTYDWMSNSPEENIAKIPKNLNVNTASGDNSRNNYENKILFTDRHIQNLSSEKAELNTKVINKLQNIDVSNNDDILDFLDVLVTYKVKSERLEELKKKYEEAKAREQSLENRMLTAATVAVMGIGGMELAQGLAEQSADAAAERDMTAYIETMRCSYADGKSVKAGAEPIELPGGNDEIIMKLRNEYFALAADLKERKEALGMKPGIESEIVLDKANMGLYDDENVGIESGAYSSLYRAKQGNETDQAMINADKEKSEKRVNGGGIAVGAGAAIGVVGNYLINGKVDETQK